MFIEVSMKINKPVTIVFEPEEIARTLDALSERPFKDVAVLIQNIVNQIKAGEDAKPEQHVGAGN